MDERDFKRHLRDLAHGHHHPEEHDWAQPQGGTASKPAKKKAPAKTAARRRKAK